MSSAAENACKNAPIAALLTLLLAMFTLFVAFTPSCAHREQSASTRWGEIAKHGVAQSPVVVGVFHGDTRMVGTHLQTAVERSIVDLERSSCGLVKLSVVWDFDSERDLARSVMRGDNVIAGVTSKFIKEALDEKDTLLGYTIVGRVFLVVDELEDPELAEWVSLHELGHAVGLEHVRLGVMQEESPFFLPPPVWERDDLREFCRVYDCNIDMFDDCRKR